MKRDGCSEEETSLFRSLFSAVSCASLSFFASWGAQRREHAPSELVQQRAEAGEEEARRPRHHLAVSCFAAAFLTSFDFFVPRAARLAPRAREPGPRSARPLAAGSERATRWSLRRGQITESICLKRRAKGRVRRSPLRSDWHRSEKKRSGGGGEKRQRGASVNTPSHCRGFLSPLRLSFSFSKNLETQKNARS